VIRNSIWRRSTRVGLSTAAIALVVCAAGTADAQVVDNKVPLNYNFHGYAHQSEAVTGATNANADAILFRSIADRGLYWDPADTHAFGTNPIIGVTGIGYGLFNTLSYGNTTAANANANGLDSVHLGTRVFNRGMETTANASTSTGNAVAWAPIFNVTSLSSDGATITGVTDTPHGLSVGQRINIAGANPIGFTGAFTVASLPDTMTFTCTPVAPGVVPAAGSATGSIFCNSTSTPLITALSGTGTVVTATTSWVHGFTATTNSVNITGADIAGYNGLYVLATVNTPNTQSFTYANTTTGTPTGTQIYLATCDHTGEQTTTLASPVTLDANTEIGVLYTISDSGGEFEAVLNFTDSTSVSVWVAGLDWTGTTIPPSISDKVSATGLVKHTVGGTTSSNFRALSGNDTGNLLAFGSTSIQVAESVISVPKFTAAGVNIVGKTLGSITFRNAFFNPTQITALSVAGGVATATVSSNAGFIPGMSIRIGGVLSSNAGNVREFDGDYRIDSLNSTNQFRFLTSATGTASAKMFASAPAGTVQVSGIATSGANPTVTATVTTASAHGFSVGDVVTIEGASVALENGRFSILTVPTTTTFTYRSLATGTPTANMQATRSGVGRGYQVHAVSVRTGAPTNASCSTAIAIPTANALGTVVTGSTSHATTAAGDPAASACGTSDSAAVYYAYTAAGNDPVVLTVCAPFTSTISAYSGTCGALTSVACSATNTSNCGGASGNSSSTVTINAVAGQTYFIRVAGQSGAMGTFSLTVQEFTNVNCTGAVPIAAGDTNGTTIVSANTATTPCGAAGNDKNAVWFQYTVGGTGTHTVEARTCLDGQTWALATPVKPLVTGVTGVRTTDPPSASMAVILPLDTTIAVYADCSGGAPIVCNDDGCSVSSRVQWTANAGQTYLIRVASKGTTAGNFVLHIDDQTHTDLPMPLQFNWNGICHGTSSSAGPNFFSEQCVTTPQSHENRSDLNGFRAISDRGLLFDPNGTTANAFNYGGTIGYQGMQYQVYNTPLQMDIVHLGTRTSAGFQPTTTTWASPTTTTPNNGYLPLWLPGDVASGTAAYNHTTWTSSTTGLNATFGDNTKLGLIYHMTNLSANVGSFQVTLTFADTATTTVTVQGTDWFGGNSATPYNGALPASPPAGVETHRVLGIYNAVQNFDRGDAASATGALKVVESVISTSSLVATGFDPRMHGVLTSVTFGNISSTDVNTNAAVFAATLRDPASYTLNYPPSGVGTVTPNQLNAGGTGKMTVSVSRGTPPNNAISSVVVDASAIGLSPTFALNDSATNGDVTAGDSIWSRNVSFPINAVPNAYSLPFTVTDSQGRTATGNIIFSVVAPTGSLTPSVGVIAGVTSVHASFVFGTAGGISSIVLDGTQIGLSATLALNDSGTGGDTAANDGTWGVNFIPAGTTAPATYLIPYVITDTAANTASGTLSLTIIPPPPANDDCAGAIALTSGTPYNGDSTQATSNDGAAAAVCPTTNPTNVTKAVWFSFTPATSGAWLVSSCGTTRDTVMTVFNAGVTCSGISTAANILGCQDDNGPGCTGTAASLAPTLAAGSTYLIRLSDFSAASAGGAYTIVVNPYTTGACCNNTTGACTDVASATCSATTSTYSGDNTTCAANPCAVAGVCCNNTSGACTSIYGGSCPSGTTAAVETVCGVSTCPPAGTCCDNASGACTPTYSLSCAASATFNAATSCTPAPCTAAGTCCNNASGVCTLIYGGSCPTGTGAGAGTSCLPNTCPSIGVCCDNTTGACSQIFGGYCPASATYNDTTLVCSPSPCPQIQWACCFADGSCLSLYQADCTSHSGAIWAPGQTCGAYACPSCTNVLANPGAETGDMTGWTIDANGGNGWSATAAGPVRSGTNAFSTSYSLSRRHQTVDLTQFFTTAQLDAAPDLAAGEWVGTRFDQAGQYYVLVQLLAADGTTVIASYNDGTQTALTQIPAGTALFLVSHTFSAYGPGVRFLRFEDGGRDVSTWAGNYGARFDDAFAGPTSVTSACCSSVGCSVITNAACITAGGIPQACGTSCSPSPCPGVCCRGSTCNAGVGQSDCAVSVGSTAGALFVSSASSCNAGNISNAPCCYANYNKINGITVQDIFDFLTDWFAGRPSARVGGDGVSGTLSVQNIFDFLTNWFAGGCT
jgi:hypothetical protein